MTPLWVPVLVANRWQLEVLRQPLLKVYCLNLTKVNIQLFRSNSIMIHIFKFSFIFILFLWHRRSLLTLPLCSESTCWRCLGYSRNLVSHRPRLQLLLNQGPSDKKHKTSILSYNTDHLRGFYEFNKLAWIYCFNCEPEITNSTEKKKKQCEYSVNVCKLWRAYLRHRLNGPSLISSKTCICTSPLLI